jgi:arylsulfatase A-like enzyme
MYSTMKIFFAALVLFFYMVNGALQASDGKKPNILFILADDLGYGDLGCYGQQIIKTPHIDTLAQEGMKFQQHYAGSPVCAPSRCTLLTGKHSGHATIRGNGPFEIRPTPLDATVFEKLKQAGYKTGLIGKSGLSGDIQDGGQPNRKGVDHFFGFVDHSKAHHYFPSFLFRNGERVEYPGNSSHEGDQYSADKFFKEAVQFLEENAKEPFFLHYATQLPHASLYATEEWKKLYRGQFQETPLSGQTHYRNEPEPRTTYAAMVSRLDWEVGELVKKLQELGIADNTVVIFASDNGPTSVAGYAPAFFGSSGPFRGVKRDLYEGGLRVPLIVRWPGKIAAGSESGHVSAFWDFMPTACDLAGVPIPEDADGISYFPTLVGEAGQQRRHDHLYWEFYESGGKRAALMDGRWKAVQLNVRANPDGPIRIYDLDADRHEDADLSGKYPDKVQQAKSIFAQEHAPSEFFSWNKAK